MKKILLGIFILTTMCVAKSIEIHSNNYDEYTFETNDATYTIVKNSYDNYSLFKSTKATGEMNKILMDRKLYLILGHLVSRDAVAVKLYPIKEIKEDKNFIKTKDN